ncbi:MAG: SDR family oxidoreductase [Candidatus Lokiarchaeota archaeon]|nr:SDR family oxidoreductase [Candidatus Lokiarchaeota archaeon]MBD3199291.1 SDR family oxidoreductase [Candidatus Lokiarchaeota archaeon]
MNEKFLDGKGVLITGGASGFGEATALSLAKKGADIVLVDIDEAKLNNVVQKIKKETEAQVFPLICDVSDSEEVQNMAKKAFHELDNIYVLFNNAGIGNIYGPDLLRMKEDIFDSIINTNLRGQWLVAKYICKKMKRQKLEPLAGKVICTASIAGVVANPKLCAYSISKAGVISMMKSLAKTLAPKITVNAISPGYHVTGIYKTYEAMKATMNDGNVKTPLNRVGTIDDVVKLILYLVSDKSNFTTGHNFIIDGGIAEVGLPANYLDSDV